ncbi:MAG: recombinase family protein [Clostridia bacterium]|nr:recombinase family protein [Clostridia bacterium]
MYDYNAASIARKVAVYARVSTEHEAQLIALENQKDWYKPILEQHPEWDVVRMYVDEGITGTSAKKRPEFLQMIDDADDGEFDLILTREVSRFARNTVDTLQYTRRLKAKGVEVFFINDNIKTFDGDGELRLTIMATLAQDESRKTSIRVKSGQQTSMNNGVFYGNGNILGYDRVGKEMIINPEQAKTVRMIYDLYLDGVGIRAIKFRMEQAGRLTAMGKSNWHESNISKILQNSFYCGIITYHKEFVPDYLEQKKIRNFGDIEFTQVKGTHTPIVTEEEFNRVQEMIAKRRQELNVEAGRRKPNGVRQPGDVWTDILVCECGHKFNRKVWHRVRDDVQYGYQCYSSIRTGTIETRKRKGLPLDGVCKTPMIAGWKLQMMAKHIFKEYLTNTDEILSLAESMLANHIADKEKVENNDGLIKQKSAEAEKLNKRLHNLIEMRADGEISKEVFRAKQSEIRSRINALQKEIDGLKPREEQHKDDATYEEKIAMLRYYLKQSISPADGSDIPDDVIKAFVVKIVAHEDGFDWYLRFDPDKPPQTLGIKGRRKGSAEVSSLCYQQHRQRSTLRSNFQHKYSIKYNLPLPISRQREICRIIHSYRFRKSANKCSENLFGYIAKREKRLYN